jgi:hypothetical protein
MPNYENVLSLPFKFYKTVAEILAMESLSHRFVSVKYLFEQAFHVLNK